MKLAASCSASAKELLALRGLADTVDFPGRDEVPLTDKSIQDSCTFRIDSAFVDAPQHELEKDQVVLPCNSFNTVALDLIRRRELGNWLTGRFDNLRKVSITFSFLYCGF